jgi:hypothetical protein
MDEEFAPLTTPGCIVKTRTVSLAFECRAEPTRAGLIMIDDEVFLSTGLTNARTEGRNGLIKQVKRAACGFRNRENYRRRVRLHCSRLFAPW